MICVEVHSNNVLTVRNDTFANAVSDSQKHETVKFLFSDNWKDYQKTAVFSAKGVEPVNIVLNGENKLCVAEDECYIPFEVLKGDSFLLSVFGVKGESLATTTQAEIVVFASGYALGDAPQEPTQDEYGQILDIMVQTKEIAQSVRKDADSGLFRGPKGDSGDQGVQGEKGDKGDSGVYVGSGEMPEGYNIQIDPNGDANVNATPDYWQSALEEGAKAINTALCTAGSNKSAFLFYSDAHWNNNSQMSPKLLKYLYEHTGMTKTIYGGDIVNNEGTAYEDMKYLWEWRNRLKDLPNHHSVVGNHDDGNATNNIFSQQYVYGYLLSAEETPDVVRGDEGMYYYIDNSPEKTRYLYLDTAYQGMNLKQQEFIKNALITTPDSWHIVVIAHLWYDPDYEQYDVRPIPIVDMADSASAVVEMLDAYNSRTGDYANCGGWVEFCIGGHVHRDYDGATDTGIPIILVETDSKNIRGNFDYTEGTTTEASVNGIIADYDNHKIYVVRVGRGESRVVEISLEESTDKPYTNQIPISIDTDGSVFNGVGYRSGKRINSSGVIKDSTENYLTGFIPFTHGDVMYISSDIFNGDTGSCNVVGYDSNKEFLATVYTDNSNGAITLNSDGTYSFDPTKIPSGSGSSQWVNIAYVRVSGMNINNSSVITVNETIN